MRRHVVGRVDELEAVHRFLRSDGVEPRLLVIEGGAGIGKSTVWTAGVDRARELGMRLLVSRPTKVDEALGFAGLGDLLEGVVDELLGSLRTARRNALEAALLLGEAGSRVDPRALGVAVRDVLTLLAAEGPVVIAVDDVQWLDGSSASALGFAVRRLEAPLAMLLTRRLEPGSEESALERAFAADSMVRVRVGPLSVEATQAVIRTNLGRTVARPTLVRIHRTAAGNPFYALELARAVGDHVDPTLPLPVPGSLDELMAARLAGLPDGTRLGLGLVAAAGEPSWMLLRAAGADPATLESALSANVLESTATAVRFSHPLLASTYYGRMTPTRRQETHRLLAGLLTEPIERARHLAIATDTADAQIAVALEEAAESAAARGAIAAAAELQRHALRLTPPDAGDDLHRRTVALARALYSNADVSRANELARTLLDRNPTGTRRAETLVLLYDLARDDVHAPRFMREALDEAEAEPALRVRILRSLGWDLRFTEGSAAAEPYAEAALAVADGLGDDELLATALAVAASSRLHLGRAGVSELAGRAFDLVSTLGDLAVRADVAGYLLMTCIATRDFDRLRGLLESLCVELTERAEWLAAGAFWDLAVVECLTGRLRLAADLAARAHELAAIYNPRAEQVSDRYLEALIAAHRGDLGAAGLAAIQALELAREQLPWWIPNCAGVAGLAALWNGDAAGACAHFAAAERAKAENGSRDPGVAAWRPHYVDALLALGRIDDASALLDGWEREAGRLKRSWVLVVVSHRRGLIAAARGDLAGAETLLQHAVADHARRGELFDRGRALLDLGVVRRRARKKRSARETIEASIAVFDDCGAERWAERERAELGTLSGRTRQVGLSAAEQRVAVLAAAGRTNREIAAELFLSERTIENHLSHAYTKLGVRSRTELARAVESRR